jgi:hypothetical protein
MFLSVRSRRVPSRGLDNGGKPGEAAAALAVHHLICHQALYGSPHDASL